MTQIIKLPAARLIILKENNHQPTEKLSEARQVAYNVISEVNQAINTLNRARSWGI
ncbi:hypothetical protein M0R79_01360 [Ignavigranum ruoffiae]|uniref:hypothetical protein n=1 Tax=Ignavigranum ruoffiae TaxID=89093 RepID=UPI002048B997|nr:hypothetical protein [Ignavigranum ruoffiae]UPQ86052.1 hypothetical protein M0R79_01360 [Ignavigranum ruoffiae]